jgi:hypothetical protein
LKSLSGLALRDYLSGLLSGAIKTISKRKWHGISQSGESVAKEIKRSCGISP